MTRSIPLAPPYWRAYLSLRATIRSGEFAPGGRLPSQAQLARRCGVSLETVRKALALLEREGYVLAHHGSGTYVAAELPTPDPPDDSQAVSGPDGLYARSFSSAQEAMGEVLALLSSRLRMESVFVSRIDTDSSTFEIVAERGMPPGYGVGYHCPLGDTYCGLAVSSTQPTLVPDSRTDPAFASLPVTRAMDIGSYVGVPLRLSDGQLYGTLCALDPRARELGDREAEFIVVLGRLLAWQLEQAQLRGGLLEEAAAIAQEARTLIEELGEQDGAQGRLQQLAARADELERLALRLTALGQDGQGE